MSDAILHVRGLQKRFGGLAAVDEVSFDVNMGAVHAIIGPNGAGKTTLINMLSGDLAPTAGSVVYRGRDISRLAPERRARLGIGRSYQKINIFPDLSVLENCRIAAHAREPRPFNWLRDALSYDGVLRQAYQALDAVALAHRSQELALSLSHGEQRQLEIAMCLAIKPELLLLDEPLAGMGAEESTQMVDLIRRLALEHAVLMVEHDMDAVFQLAQILTVMVNGKILATGAPAEIRANREVQEAYLGTPEEPL